MPWRGCPPAPARAATGEGSPTNSRTIAVTGLSNLRVTSAPVKLSLDLHPGITPWNPLKLRHRGDLHGVAERGVRPRRRQSPRAGLLRHEADCGVLHAGARYAADQDDRLARGLGPALLLRHGPRGPAGILLGPRP